MSDDQGRLDRVRKLLAQAEDPASTPAERDAFNERAAALIAKYGIEQALLDAATVTTKPMVVGDRIVHVPGPYAGEKSALLHNVAEPLRVHTVRRNGKRSQGFDVHAFGFSADLDRVDLLFTSLLVQASHQLVTVQPAHGESPVTYRKAWMAGFTGSVRARLEAAESRATQEARESGDGPSTDLVLADRKAIVDRGVAEAYPDLKTLPSIKVRGTGYRAGQTAGQRADLGGTRISHRVSRRSIGQ